MVRRHVRQGAAYVARQRVVVAKLHAKGQPTEAAEQLLATFEDLQRQHEIHLARLEGQPDQPGAAPEPAAAPGSE